MVVSDLKKTCHSNTATFIRVLSTSYMSFDLFFYVFMLPPPPSPSADCHRAVLQHLIMLLSVDHRALRGEIHPGLFMYLCSWVCCLGLRVSDFVDAKTQRASVEHQRVMHALSQVDSGRECVLHFQSREPGNFMLLGAYSTHPGAMHCEAGGRMGH